VGRSRGRRARVHHEVHHRQEVPVLPEKLADPSLDAIARDGAAGDAHGDREPEAWMVKAVRSGAHEKERIGRAQPRTLNSIELRLRE
jgi:hypothetical protein